MYITFWYFFFFRYSEFKKKAVFMFVPFKYSLFNNLLVLIILHNNDSEEKKCCKIMSPVSQSVKRIRYKRFCSLLAYMFNYFSRIL